MNPAPKGDPTGKYTLNGWGQTEADFAFFDLAQDKVELKSDGWRTEKIADVARRAKVGAGTVSRVLNGSKNVSEETRQRVQACIRELGYLPNLVARGLAANRTGMLSAVIPAIGYTQYAEVIQGLSDILQENGIRLMIGHCGYSLEREEQIVTDFLEASPGAPFNRVKILLRAPASGYSTRDIGDADRRLFQLLCLRLSPKYLQVGQTVNDQVYESLVARSQMRED
jgi:hypothetical protein